MAIRVDALNPTVLPSLEHEFPAMKDGLTVKLTLQQVYDLIEIGLAAGAPPDLNTLAKMASAIGNDPVFSNTVAASLNTLAAGLAARLRFDSAQTLSPAEKLLAIANLGLGYTFKRIVRITSSQFYTRPSNVRAILILGVAAGGAGGSANTPSGTPNVGGGGGAGEYGVIFIENPGASYAVTIGAGGAPGAPGGAAGGNGGDASFDSALSLKGGVGGPGGSSTATPPYVVGQGTGGEGGSGGDLRIPGEFGMIGIILSSASRLSGDGASSPFGRGGRCVANNSNTVDQAGRAAFGYGAGGSGGMSSTTVQRQGGAGAPGYFEVWEYV